MKPKSTDDDKQKKINPRKPKDQAIKCQFCPKTFSALRWNTGHCNRDHPDLIKDSWRLCEPCNIYFPTEASLFTHKGQKHFPKKTSSEAKGNRESCKYCSKTFLSRKEYLRHCSKSHKSVQEKGWIECTKCQQFFESNYHLKCHVQRVHNKDGLKKKSIKTINCEFCPKQFPTSARNNRSPYYNHCYEEHQNNILNQWELCEVCGFYFPHHRMNRHKLARHKIQDKIKCHFCPKTSFIAARSFNVHCNAHHVPEISKTWLRCSGCEMFIRTEEELNKHQTTVHKQFRCQFCNKEIGNQAKFQQHIQIQHYQEASLTWVKCQNCKFLFEKSDQLQSHSCMMQTETHCEFCPQILFSSISYIKHAKNKHKSDISKKWILCKSCSIMFPTDIELSKHKCYDFIQKEKIDCEFCDKVFISHVAYTTHANIFHSQDIVKRSWISCSSCPLYFPPNSVAIRGHMLLFHPEKPKPFQCHLCPNSFSRPERLTIHMNKAHFDFVKENWHRCNLCNKYLSNKAKMTNHKTRFHSSERNVTQRTKVECPFCAKLFSSQNLNLHANKSHQDRISQDWQCCDLCNLYYPTTHGLSVHQRHAHSDQIAKIACQFCLKKFSSSQTHFKHVNVQHKEEASKTWFSCKVCQVLFSTNSRLSKHTIIKHTEKSKTFRPNHSKSNRLSEIQTKGKIRKKKSLKNCKHCGEGNQNLSFHLNSKHQDKIPKEWFSCEACPWFYKNKDQLTDHLKLTHQTKAEKGVSRSCLKHDQCKFCPEMFLKSKANHYYQHAREVHKEKVEEQWMACKQCNRLYPSQESLQKHSWRKHRKKIRETETTNHHSPVSDTTTKCEHCEEKKPADSELSYHLNSRHKDMIPNEWVKCESCQWFYSSKEKLIGHTHYCLKMAENSQAVDFVQCQFCPEVFQRTRLQAYYKHANNFHNNEIDKKWRGCQNCNYFYPTEHILLKHFGKSHNIKKGRKTSIFDRHESSKRIRPDSESRAVQSNEIVNEEGTSNESNFAKRIKEENDLSKAKPKTKKFLILRLLKEEISSWHRCMKCGIYTRHSHQLLQHDIVSHSDLTTIPKIETELYIKDEINFDEWKWMENTF